MPKAKKSSSSDSDSGPDDHKPPSPKKSKESSTDKKKSNDCDDVKNHWILEKQRQVRVNEFRGRKLIDIREYFEKNGETLPGKKGISLTVDQWHKLLAVADEINQSLK